MSEDTDTDTFFAPVDPEGRVMVKLGADTEWGGWYSLVNDQGHRVNLGLNPPPESDGEPVHPMHMAATPQASPDQVRVELEHEGWQVCMIQACVMDAEGIKPLPVRL